MTIKSFILFTSIIFTTVVHAEVAKIQTNSKQALKSEFVFPRTISNTEFKYFLSNAEGKTNVKSLQSCAVEVGMENCNQNNCFTYCYYVLLPPAAFSGTCSAENICCCY